jgi:outer membrane receptor for ferrienterochelin and colicins
MDLSVNTLDRWRRSLAVSAFCAGVATGGNLCAAEVSRARLEDTQRDWQQAELLAVLDEATELATKNRVNVDYVPGIMTVLERAEMLALGVRTVAEALTLVPGVLVERDGTGEMRLSIRGQENSTGTVKILIDSVPMNTSDGALLIFDEMPVEQVERIEVIRGPGSALYGEFAFSGVVNIVTLQRARRAHVRYGDANTTEVGGVYSLEDPERDVSLTMNLAGWDSRSLGIEAGPDSLYPLGLGDFSNAPGTVDDGQDYRFGQLRFNAGDFFLLAQYQATRTEPFFGAIDILPGPMQWGDEGTALTKSVIQAGYARSLSARSRAELKVHWHEGWMDSDQRLAPAGLPALGIGAIMPEDSHQKLHTHSNRIQLDAALDWEGWTDHRMRFEVSVAEDKMLEAWWAFNLDLLTLEPLPFMRRYSGELGFIDPAASRTIRSVVFQDQWSARADLDLTLGVRYDAYSDVGDNVSPRLAAVWRLADQHVLKAQVASAFFPPSLLQRHIQSFLPVIETARDPETSRTAELAYIFRRADTVGRVSAYYSRLYDLITANGSTWVNLGEARTRGVELEWQQAFGRRFKLKADLSYADTLNDETGGPIPGAATWLGNLSLFYYLASDVLLAGRWNYVGDRARDIDDSRSELPGYSNVTLTLSWFNVGAQDLDLRLGLTNLLGENIRSPAPALTYDEDYPLVDERALWVQLSYALP